MVTTPDCAHVGRALLALIGHRANEAANLPEAHWRMLDAMAEQHRLQPFLHYRAEQGAIPQPPATIRKAWRRAYHENGVAILAQRRALLQAVQSLGASGIGAVALKGSALAWTVWPEPALRVMRDIDLLVAQEDAGKAYACLIDAGWEGPVLDTDQTAHFAACQTHFPPLRSPDRVWCELHAHVWLRPAVPGMPMPMSCDAQMLAHARYEERLGAAVPGTQDMLAHLVVHAACAHLLNVGPGALVDIDTWCARKRVDWPAFWRQAEASGYARPAALVFALVDRWRRPGFLDGTGCAIRVDEALLDASELLLVQDLDTRKDVSALSSLGHGQVRVRLAQDPLDRANASLSPIGRLGQLAQRFASLARSVLRRETRRTARQTAALQAWLSG